MAITKISAYAELDSESRCDAEHITAPVLIKENYWRGRDVISFSQYGTSKALNEHGKGFPVLRLNEFENMFIKSPEKYCDLINEKTYKELKLSKGDVLVCRTNGNPDLVGKAAVVMEDTDCAFASYVFKIRPNSRISPQVLVVYLNSKYGRSEIKRHQMISIQTNFSPERFKKCHVPYLSPDFQTKINGLVDKAYSSVKRAKELYVESEKILGSELKLDGFIPSNKKISVRNMADSFQSSNRIDAEYYQEIYDDYAGLISGYHYGTKSISKALQINDKNYVPQNNAMYRYIELANVGAYGEINGYIEDLGSNLPSRARRLIKKGDVIISSIEGSLQSCALITDEYDNTICSTGFHVIKSKDINSETLLVLFKSKAIQSLLKKGCSGTILTAISKTELGKIGLPIIHGKVQKKISSLIIESFKLRNESKTLLEKAKQAVEIAVSEGEKKAIKFLST